MKTMRISKVTRYLLWETTMMTRMNVDSVNISQVTIATLVLDVLPMPTMKKKEPVIGLVIQDM